MQVNDQLVNHMLKNLPQEQQAVMSAILRNEVAYEVICDSEDTYGDVEVPVLDKKGNPKTNKDGTPKMTTESQVIQEGTKGRTIAYINKDGSVTPVADENGTMWLRASRRRTDGEYGFECWCGRDSRIAPNEQGILHANGNQPSKEDLYAMAANLEKNPPQYQTVNGDKIVDGFIIREIQKEGQL